MTTDQIVKGVNSYYKAITHLEEVEEYVGAVRDGLEGLNSAKDIEDVVRCLIKSVEGLATDLGIEQKKEPEQC